MRAPGLIERRAFADVDGTGSYGGSGDYGGNSYDSGGGGSGGGGTPDGTIGVGFDVPSAAPADPVSNAWDGPLAGVVGEKAGPSYADERGVLGALGDWLGAKAGDAAARPAETAINTAVGMVPGVGLINSLLGLFGFSTVGSTVTGTIADAKAAVGPFQAPTADYADQSGSSPYGAYSGSRGAVFGGNPFQSGIVAPNEAASVPTPGFLPDGQPGQGPYRASLDDLDAAAAPAASGGTQAATIAGLPVGPLVLAAALAAGVAFG